MILRQLELKDISGMLEWMHDSRINRFFLFNAQNMTEEKAAQFIKNSLEDANARKQFHFAIADEQDRYLGTISLKNIDWTVQKSEYAISLREAAQGRGVAFWATQMILAYAFRELRLHRVYLNVLPENDRAIRFYEKVGFVYEGEFREHVCSRGKYRNLKWYSMLDYEFEAPNIEKTKIDVCRMKGK